MLRALVGQPAHPSAGEVGVDHGQHRQQLVGREVPLPVGVHDGQQEGHGDRPVHKVEAAQQAIDAGFADRRSPEVAVVPGVGAHLGQHVVDVVGACAHPGAELLVEVVLLRGAAESGGEPVANELGAVEVDVLLHGIPVLLVEPLLLLVRLPHEHEVADHVGLREVEAGGVEALEDELGVVALLELQSHHLKPADGVEEPAGFGFAPAEAFDEVAVVDREVGGLVEVLPVGEQLLVGVGVGLHGLQLEFATVGRVLGVEVVVADPLGQVGVGLEGAVRQAVVECEEEQVHRGEALLTVDDDYLADGALDLVDDGAEEVVRTLEPDDVEQVVEEAGAVSGSPVVVALVDRDDEASVLALEDVGERLERSLHGSVSLSWSNIEWS